MYPGYDTGFSKNDLVYLLLYIGWDSDLHKILGDLLKDNKNK